MVSATSPVLPQHRSSTDPTLDGVNAQHRNDGLIGGTTDLRSNRGRAISVGGRTNKWVTVFGRVDKCSCTGDGPALEKTAEAPTALSSALETPKNKGRNSSSPSEISQGDSKIMTLKAKGGGGSKRLLQ
jgi:hypothetical protein